MSRSLQTSLCLLAATLLLGAAPVQADFNGEVLIAPPPPNWTGGAEEKHDTGIRRTWQRPGTSSVEKITLTQLTGISGADAGPTAQMTSYVALGGCAVPSISDPIDVPAEIGHAASVTATCKDGGEGVGIFSVIYVYVGEFNTYSIVRVWYGDPKDPTSPAISPRAAEDWQTYFERTAVCNTLTSPCDVDAALLTHAHPRFTTMRNYEAAAAPVLDQADLLRGAKGLGELTGRAAACGEDVSSLSSKIDRMFEHVTANDRDAFDAIFVFGKARIESEQQQTSLPRDSCGEILRTFRQHPSRVGAFPRYIEGFF